MLAVYSVVNKIKNNKHCSNICALIRGDSQTFSAAQVFNSRWLRVKRWILIIRYSCSLWQAEEFHDFQQENEQPSCLECVHSLILGWEQSGLNILIGHRTEGGTDGNFQLHLGIECDWNDSDGLTMSNFLFSLPSFFIYVFIYFYPNIYWVECILILLHLFLLFLLHWLSIQGITSQINKFFFLGFCMFIPGFSLILIQFNCLLLPFSHVPSSSQVARN